MNITQENRRSWIHPCYKLEMEITDKQLKDYGFTHITTGNEN